MDEKEIKQKIKVVAEIDAEDLDGDLHRKNGQVSARITDAAKDLLTIFGGKGNSIGNLNEVLINIREALINAINIDFKHDELDFSKDIGSIIDSANHITSIIRSTEAIANRYIKENIIRYEEQLQAKDTALRAAVEDIDKLSKQFGENFDVVNNKQIALDESIDDLTKKLQHKETECEKLKLEQIESQKKINYLTDIENQYKIIKEQYRDLEVKVDRSKSDIKKECAYEIKLLSDAVEKLKVYIDTEVVNLVAKNKLKQLKSSEQILSDNVQNKS